VLIPYQVPCLSFAIVGAAWLSSYIGIVTGSRFGLKDWNGAVSDFPIWPLPMAALIDGN